MKALLVASPRADALPLEQLLRDQCSDVNVVPAGDLAVAASAGVAIVVLVVGPEEADLAAIVAVCRLLRGVPDGGPVLFGITTSASQAESLCDEGVDDFMLWPSPNELFTARVGLLFRRLSQRKKDTVRAGMLADALRHAERSEQRFRHLAESSTEILARFSPGGVRLYISPACRSVLGYEPDELLGSSILDILHPSDVQKLLEALGALDAGAQVAGAIIRLQRKDGEYAWLETISRPVRDPRTDVIEEFVTVSRDITAMIHAEHDKLQAEARLAEIDAIPDPLFVEDESGRFSLVNRAFTELIGRPREELVDHTVDDVKPAPAFGPDRWPATSDEREVSFTKPDGARRVLVERRAVLGARKDDRVLVSILHDVTDERRREGEARAEVVSKLSSSVAHEINGPLSYVIGNLGFLSETIEEPEGSDIAKAIAEALHGAKRLTAISRSLRVFGASTSTHADVAHAVDTALLLTRSAIEAKARLVTEIVETPSARAGPGRPPALRGARAARSRSVRERGAHRDARGRGSRDRRGAPRRAMRGRAARARGVVRSRSAHAARRAHRRVGRAGRSIRRTRDAADRDDDVAKGSVEELDRDVDLELLTATAHVDRAGGGRRVDIAAPDGDPNVIGLRDDAARGIEPLPPDLGQVDLDPRV